MKKYVITASEETELEKATDIMGYMQIRRLVVVNNENKIVRDFKDGKVSNDIKDSMLFML